MKIIDNTTPPDSVQFADLMIGEVFLDLDLETPSMKIRENVDADNPTSCYVNNTVDLSNGDLYHCDDNEAVRRIRSELVISNW